MGQQIVIPTNLGEQDIEKLIQNEIKNITPTGTNASIPTTTTEPTDINDGGYWFEQV